MVAVTASGSAAVTASGSAAVTASGSAAVTGSGVVTGSAWMADAAALRGELSSSPSSRTLPVLSKSLVLWRLGGLGGLGGSRLRARPEPSWRSLAWPGSAWP